jgi:hypothetical protein
VISVVGKAKELPEKDKRSQSSVDFEEESTHRGQSCGHCKHFIRAVPPRCQGVKNSPLPILAGSWCERFKKA